MSYEALRIMKLPAAGQPCSCRGSAAGCGSVSCGGSAVDLRRPAAQLPWICGGQLRICRGSVSYEALRMTELGGAGAVSCGGGGTRRRWGRELGELCEL